MTLWHNARIDLRSKNGVRNIDKGYYILDRWIHRGRAEVTHWTPLPKFPKEDAV